MDELKNIIVNATALRSGGGLTILNQFLDKIEIRIGRYYIFIDSSIDVDDFVKTNIKFIKVNKRSMFSRIIWDSYGLKKYLKSKNISPNIVISLQNTSLNIGSNIPQVIYLHQALPFCEIEFTFFNKNERKFFLYRYFYKYFIFKYFKSNTHFVVQTEWVKRALLKLHYINEENVSVISPEVSKINFNDIEKIGLPVIQKSLFYPASALKYKNHEEIVNALLFTRDTGADISNIVVYLTIKAAELPSLSEAIKKNDLGSNFRFLGNLSYEKVLAYYKSTDILLFPSYLETFGLPLIEAASFGMPIIVSDLEYSRDVLSNYKGVFFCEVNNSSDWSRAIIKVLSSENKSYVYCPSERFGWDNFFRVIKERLKNV